MVLKAEQRVRVKTTPVFLAHKNGRFLKCFFFTTDRDFLPHVGENDEEEKTRSFGRHKNGDQVTHHYLKVRSVPSRQKLFVTNLSSGCGTWVKDQKVEQNDCVEVKEGDDITMDCCDSHAYRMKWISGNLAYDIHNHRVDVSTLMKQDDENKMLQAEYLEVANQVELFEVQGSPIKAQIDGSFKASGSAAFRLPSQVEIPRLVLQVTGETESNRKEVGESSGSAAFRLPSQVEIPRLVRQVTGETESNRKEVGESSTKPLESMVWWDLENCQVPTDCDAGIVVQRIDAALEELGFAPAKKIRAVIAVPDRAPSRVQAELKKEEHSTVKNRRVCYTCIYDATKDASDRRIISEMEGRLTLYMPPPKPAAIMLISSDGGFARTVHTLNNRGYTTLVVYNPLSASQETLDAAHWKREWRNVLRLGGSNTTSRWESGRVLLPAQPRRASGSSRKTTS